ncbi:MAG: DUF63 family protein [Thermoplasmatales archaeon]|nr:DUF63 family protein [Thermoplasmatales archaeon]
MKDIKEFYKKHRFLIWILTLVLPAAGLFLGCVFWKNMFWDNFLWKYYWGTVVSDAENRIINGIGPEYNIVNTLTYGVILAGALFLIYRLLRKLEITPGYRFFVSLSPFILLGSVLRVMEDADFFPKPWIYLFISPLIYVFLGLTVLLLLLIGDIVEKRFEKKNIRNKTLFFSGVIPLSICTCLLFSRGLQRPDAVLLILGTASLLTAVVFSAFKLLKSPYPKLSTYVLGSNVLLFFAHFLDASATFVGTDFYNYAEKHPLPAFLINLSGTGAVMYPLKFVLIFLIIYVLDIIYKKEIKDISRKNQKFFLKSYGKLQSSFPKILGIHFVNSVKYQENAESVFRDKTLTGLIKICVFILGLAPGVRDMLRIGIGV